jgi:hypothetical protein
MMKSKDWVVEQILEFMTVLYHCYSTTRFSEDRTLYAKDIAIAMGWLAHIRSNQDLEAIIRDILSPETDKYFGDYWRKGEWGAKAITALSKLQEELRNAQSQ